MSGLNHFSKTNFKRIFAYNTTTKNWKFRIIYFYIVFKLRTWRFLCSFGNCLEQPRIDFYPEGLALPVKYAFNVNFNPYWYFYSFTQPLCWSFIYSINHLSVRPSVPHSSRPSSIPPSNSPLTNPCTPINTPWQSALWRINWQVIFFYISLKYLIADTQDALHNIPHPSSYILSLVESKASTFSHHSLTPWLEQGLMEGTHLVIFTHFLLSITYLLVLVTFLLLIAFSGLDSIDLE